MSTISFFARLAGVRKRYGSRLVLEHVDLAVAPGTVVGLLGRTGAGKTTLLRVLLGLEPADAGHVSLFGREASELSDAERARIGYVAQDSNLFDFMRVGEMLEYVSAFYGDRWDEAATLERLDRWGLERSRPIAELSGGERQRLAAARALGHRPDLLVLDEPVAALDPLARRGFLRELIERAAEDDVAVLFSTHITSDLERIAARVAFLHEGRIVLDDELDRLRERVRRLRFRADPATMPAKIPGGLRVERDAFGAWCAIADIDDEAVAALGRRLGQQLVAEPLSLEELFVELAR